MQSGDLISFVLYTVPSSVLHLPEADSTHLPTRGEALFAMGWAMFFYPNNPNGPSMTGVGPSVAGVWTRTKPCLFEGPDS